MRRYLANAFSLGMLAQALEKLGSEAIIHIEYLTEKQAEELNMRFPFDVAPPLNPGIYGTTDLISVIGHEATAKILSHKLGTWIPVNRQDIQLQPGDEVWVFQLLQRLPEGKVLTVEEMRNIPAVWMHVSILAVGKELREPTLQGLLQEKRKRVLRKEGLQGFKSGRSQQISGIYFVPSHSEKEEEI